MKLLSLSACVALTIASGANAQTPFFFFSCPQPRFIITNPGVGGGVNTAPGTSVESVHHVKLSNNPDGIWTTCLTGDNVEPLYGDNGTTKGVSIGIFDPYNNNYTPNLEANALNSDDDDVHLALSADGLWAIFERKDPVLPNTHKGVWLASRAAVGTAFGSPTQVSGFPASLLTSKELHPYLGTVSGTMMCFYTDGQKLKMQPIDLANAMLTGTATDIGSASQTGTQPGSPSPLLGADGDVEALWATDIVSPRTSPNTGEANPTFHNDLRDSTPGQKRVDVDEWQGWGGFAGGWCYFTHDAASGEFHSMHSEASLLLGDDEVLGGTADLTTYGTNWAAYPGGTGVPLQGAILLGTGLLPRMSGIIIDPSWGCGPFTSTLNLSGFSPIVLPTSTTALDGMASVSFPIPNIAALAGASIPLQALLVDNGPPLKPRWTNTAWLHIN